MKFKTHSVITPVFACLFGGFVFCHTEYVSGKTQGDILSALNDAHKKLLPRGKKPAQLLNAGSVFATAHEHANSIFSGKVNRASEVVAGAKAAITTHLIPNLFGKGILGKEPRPGHIAMIKQNADSIRKKVDMAQYFLKNYRLTLNLLRNTESIITKQLSKQAEKVYSQGIMLMSTHEGELGAISSKTADLLEHVSTALSRLENVDSNTPAQFTTWIAELHNNLLATFEDKIEPLLRKHLAETAQKENNLIEMIRKLKNLNLSDRELHNLDNMHNVWQLVRNNKETVLDKGLKTIKGLFNK